MSRALTGGPPAPKVPLLAIPSSGSLAVGAGPSSGSRKAPPPVRMGYRAAPAIARNNTSPVILSGQVDIPSEVLDRPIKVSPTSGLRLSSDSGAEHGLNDLDAFWMGQADSIQSNTRSGSLQSVNQGRIRRHATSEVVDLREMSDDGMASSRSDGTSQHPSTKRSSSVLDLRSSTSASKLEEFPLRKEFSSLGLETDSIRRDLAGIVSDFRGAQSLDEDSSEEESDDDLEALAPRVAKDSLAPPAQSFSLPSSLLSESLLSESSLSLQKLSTSSSINRSTDTSISSLASPALTRLENSVFAPPSFLSSTAVSSAFIASTTFDLPSCVPTSDMVTPREDYVREGSEFASCNSEDKVSATVAPPPHRVSGSVPQSASPSLPEVLGSNSGAQGSVGVAASAHRASVHLSGLFDRASSLDLHSPHPNPRSIKPDYSAFLKTNGEPGSGEYTTIVDLPIGVDADLLMPPLAHENSAEDVEDDPPLFDVAEWKRSSSVPETIVAVVNMPHIIPGVALPTNLTLKELQELHGAEIEAFVAPIRPPSPRDRIPSHPPVQRRDRRRITSSEDSLSSGPDEPRRLLEHRRAVARSIAHTTNWDYLKHSTATESSLASSAASGASSRQGSGTFGERGGTDSGRSDVSPGPQPLALSGNPPRRQHRRRRSSTSSLHQSQPGYYQHGAISDHGGGDGSFLGSHTGGPGSSSHAGASGPVPHRTSSTSLSTHDSSASYVTDAHSIPGKSGKRARRRTSPISSALELNDPIPNTIIPPTGFFPPTSTATHSSATSSASGAVPPSVVVSSSSSTSANSSTTSHGPISVTFPAGAAQDAQPVFQVEEPLLHSTPGEPGWLTAEAMMDPTLSPPTHPSNAANSPGMEGFSHNPMTAMPLGTSGNKRRSASRKKSSKNGSTPQLANSGSPQHFHHHHHHHHHHHANGEPIRSSLGDLPSMQSPLSEVHEPNNLASALLSQTFGSSSSAPSPGHALGTTAVGSSTQTSPRVLHLNHSSGHAHASDSDSSVDDSYVNWPFVRMTKRRPSRSRGGSPPPVQRTTFSRSTADADSLSAPPSTSKSLNPAFNGPAAPGAEAWNVEDVMNSLHHFNGGGRATRFADTGAGAARSSSTEHSRHRRNPSQSRLERRLREIERRLAMLEQNQMASPSQLPSIPSAAAALHHHTASTLNSHIQVPHMHSHDHAHHHASHHGSRSEPNPLASSVPMTSSPAHLSSHAGTHSPYNNQDGSSSGSGDNKSVGSGVGGHGLLHSSLVYAASATYSPQYGRKGISPPTTSSSNSSDSLQGVPSLQTVHSTIGLANNAALNASTTFASAAAAQAAAANPYEISSPASAPASSHPATGGATTNPYAVPVHESEVPSAPASLANTTATRTPDLAATDNAYNRRFQEIMELSGPSKYIQMAALGRDFVSLAEVYGRIIVSERCLPPEQKSIKPVALGGQAGGSKFIVQGILFKYALDVKIGEGSKREKWLYGGKRRDDAAAMKAASNELLGLSSFIKCNSTNNIRFPMMALIDYCGYRLVAVSTLPINASTIVYGSADAGKTVHNRDEKIANVMQDFGHDLNLREHMVFNTPITGPGDLEVHRGSDGFHYMIDFARTFPPEAPGDHAHPQSIFYRLLRPELVVGHQKPLSSDAFSGWQSGDSLSDEMNEDVEEATRRLFETVIPHYPHSSFLTHDFQALFRSEICNISDVHRRGINLRHLGLVRSEMYKATDDNDALYLVEMICRTLKSYVGMRFRALMDQLIIFAEEPFRNEALALFNLVAQPSASPEFWNVRIKTLLQRKYGASALRPEELDPTVMLLDVIPREHRLYLVRRLAWHLCVFFDDNIWNNFEDSLMEGAEFQFYPQDIKEIKPRTKYMTILDLALGITLYMQAAGAFDASRNEANILLLEEAKICLVSAWTRVADCLVTRYFLGKVWHLLGKLRTDGGEDFARALVMIESTMVEERDRPDLRVDFAKAGVMAFIHQREPGRFDRAVVHYREVSRTHPTLARTLVDDILSWLHNQHANKALDDATFAERIEAAKTVMKQVFDKKSAPLYTEMCEQLNELSIKPRNNNTPLSRSSFSGRLFTSQTNTTS